MEINLKIILKKITIPPNNKIKPTRIGELGEYKINIQLDQFPKEWKHLSDLLIINRQSITGFSQIDHVVITNYGLFVIETKNYSGKIIGKKDNKY
ncbi:nuclease-related domain-containing protein [Fredinandcohnia humi]